MKIGKHAGHLKYLNFWPQMMASAGKMFLYSSTMPEH